MAIIRSDQFVVVFVLGALLAICIAVPNLLRFEPNPLPGEDPVHAGETQFQSPQLDQTAQAVPLIEYTTKNFHSARASLVFPEKVDRSFRPMKAPSLSHWYIQVASPTNGREARQLVENLVLNELPATSIPVRVEGVPHFRVLVGPYVSKEDAKYVLDTSVRANLLRRDAFVRSVDGQG